MKNYLLTVFIVVISFSSYGQAELMGFRDYRDIADSFYMNFKGNDKFDISEVKGSPFLIENFVTGYIVDTKAENKAQTNLRYDVYNDVFEIQLNPGDESLKTLERSPRFQYMINGEKFILVQTDVLNVEHYTSGNGFVVELITPESGVGLYKRYYKNLNQGQKATTSYQTDIPPSISNEMMFLIKMDNQYIDAEAHRKDVLDAFPRDMQPQLKDFIKDKKLRFKGSDQEVENDMIQLVRYYNTL